MLTRRSRHLLLLLLFVTVPVPAVDEGSHLDQEFRQTLVRLAQAGALPAGDQPVLVERPAEKVSNFGLLVDRDHEDGLLVLGTLPGGSAEQMGLRAGDRLVAANGQGLRGPGSSERMRSLLDGIEEGDPLDLQVLREGTEQRLVGTVDSLELPAMRVELLPADGGGRVPADPDSRCARITTFPAAPRSRSLYPARLIAVDGETPGTAGQDTYRIEPGRRVLTVAEVIDSSQFQAIANMQRSREARNTYRTLEIDVQAGVTYLLAARLHRDRSTRILDASYWQPVIWKERAEPCR